MNPLRLVKRSIQVMAALLLLLMFGYPLSVIWVERHPESTAGLVLAAGHVDPDADKVTQAQQFLSNIGNGKREAEDLKREKAEDKTFEETSRKERERRRYYSEDDY